MTEFSRIAAAGSVLRPRDINWVLMQAILELQGDKLGPWAAKLKAYLDLPELATAFWDIGAHLDKVGKHQRASGAQKAAYEVGYLVESEVWPKATLFLAEADRARITDAIRALDGKAVLTESGISEELAATLAAIEHERMTLTAIGLRPVRYAVDGVEKRLSKAGTPAASSATLAESVIATVSIPKHADKVPTPDVEEVAITHNLTGRAVTVRRDSKPAISYTIATGKTLKLRSRDFLYSHTFSVGKDA